MSVYPVAGWILRLATVFQSISGIPWHWPRPLLSSLQNQLYSAAAAEAAAAADFAQMNLDFHGAGMVGIWLNYLLLVCGEAFKEKKLFSKKSARILICFTY
jgi:hypothetical protein